MYASTTAGKSKFMTFSTPEKVKYKKRVIYNNHLIPQDPVFKWWITVNITQWIINNYFMNAH